LQCGCAAIGDRSDIHALDSIARIRGRIMNTIE
jgi:hypothetical protein